MTAEPTSPPQRPPGSRWCASPNFGPRPAGAEVSLIVVHSISLPPGEYGGPAVEQLFTNTLDWDAHPYFQTIRGLEVSAHFFVRRTGEVVQFVDGHQRAWHAGRSSWCGRDNCNDYAIGIELEGLEGDTFEPAQYQALATLCHHLARQYPIEQVVGHEHIAPGRKQDPGPGFDWARLQRLTHWPAERFPPAVR
ncbi:1,6-anhydro-N-acetylmuramyl-L-alanine amidase AmpD [Macromonas nakdongensis]|uniref:1,6-anhydro-N-acetylmuramyl-L-alanine amidase AmpD n=1 Tax=Macromonas nakdongensis TaxID=1843082 RepID=UPI000C34BB87|nr:1,6-anhydro-N-acetylmuramyl-L-alanine amidase AmpD [Macromonas nakdongensis]